VSNGNYDYPIIVNYLLLILPINVGTNIRIKSQKSLISLGSIRFAKKKKNSRKTFFKFICIRFTENEPVMENIFKEKEFSKSGKNISHFLS